MVRSRSWLARALALGMGTALVVAACGGSPSQAPTSGGPPATDGGTEPTAAGDAPAKGGTLFLLTQAEGWGDVDPQRMYTGEDLAFFGGTTSRSLESYFYSADSDESNVLQPDLATDLGTASDGGQTWQFTLREGLTWEDGSELNCADVAYGVSRTFATDIMGGGPSYAIQYLDIPSGDEGSEYPGPYTATAAQQALFDEAVSCDGNTITFKLNKPVADFNYTTTLGMSPVPNPTDHPDLTDPGEGYGVTSQLWANGPYRVESYTQGPGGSMVLVRNENWNPDSDPLRPAYPDSWVIQFGVDPLLMDQRLMSPSGDDEFAMQYGQVQPQNLPAIFADADNPNPEFADRAISGFDPYSRYYWVNIEKVPSLEIRQALAVALDRQSIRTVLGGDFYGDYGTGVIKPNIGQDYADTGYYTDLFGKPVPFTGDPAFAQELIAASGEEAPTLKWNYADTPVGQQHFAAVQASLQLAGFTIEPGPIPPADYYNTVFDPDNPLTGDFGNAGWGPDWPNASTIIAPLYTQVGGWDLSQVDDEAFNAAVEDALTTLDRAEQATKWQALDKEAAQKAWTIPTFFGRSQTIAGTKVGATSSADLTVGSPIYRWPAYGSWPYGVLYAQSE
jgi:peptide/nickel transport system substrate-binding protein